MKKIITIVSAITLISINLSCKKSFLDLQPVSQLTTDNFFIDNASANAATLGVYNSLGDAYNGLSYLAFSDISTDIGRSSPISNTQTYLDFDKNTWSPVTSIINSYWTNFYKIINLANTVIVRIPKIQSSDLNTTRVAQYTGEAKFIRALSYLNLTMAFGDVPMSLVESTSATGDNVYGPRMAQSTVLKQIHQDLQEAAASLPNTYSGADVGRATKGAALAVDAEVYLFEKNYTEARAHALSVINLGIYDLMPNFRDVVSVKNGKEHIFSIQYDFSLKPNGISGNTNPQGSFIYEGMKGSSIAGATPYFLSSYPRTYRQQFTVVDSLQSTLGVMTALGTQSPTIGRYFDITISYQLRGGTTPFNSTNVNTNLNLNLFRYAGTLLTFCEADFQLNGATSQSLGYINKIRKRARIYPDGTEHNVTLLPDLTIGQLTLDAILTERRNELAFEGHRRWDLIRTGTYVTTLQAAGKTTGSKYLLFPVPNVQIGLNPNLTQNTGY